MIDVHLTCAAADITQDEYYNDENVMQKLLPLTRSVTSHAI